MFSAECEFDEPNTTSTSSFVPRHERKMLSFPNIPSLSLLAVDCCRVCTVMRAWNNGVYPEIMTALFNGGLGSGSDDLNMGTRVETKRQRLSNGRLFVLYEEAFKRKNMLVSVIVG